MPDYYGNQYNNMVLIYPYWNANEFLTRNGMDGILFLYLKSNRNWLFMSLYSSLKNG